MQLVPLPPKLLEPAAAGEGDGGGDEPGGGAAVDEGPEVGGGSIGGGDGRDVAVGVVGFVVELEVAESVVLQLLLGDGEHGRGR